MYLSKLLNVFVQIVKCICPNCKMCLSELSNVCVQIAKYICPKNMQHKFGMHLYLDASCRHFPSEWISINTVHCKNYLSKLSNIFVENASGQMYLLKMLRIFVHKIFSYIGTSLCRHFPSEWISITLTGRFPKPPPLQYWGQDWVGLKIGARRPEIQCLRRNPIFLQKSYFQIFSLQHCDLSIFCIRDALIRAV